MLKVQFGYLNAYSLLAIWEFASKANRKEFMRQYRAYFVANGMPASTADKNIGFMLARS